MKIFFGSVVNKNTGLYEHSHVSMSPDDNFYVEIWGNSEKPIILGEFRKWHHLEKEIAKNHNENLICVSEFKDVNENELVNFLYGKKNASIF
jgi:hypothetical protein